MDKGKELYNPNKDLALTKFLGAPPIGRKEVMPHKLFLPNTAISVVKEFMDYKPYGEMQGAFRFNPRIDEFEFDPKSRIEGETLDPDKNMDKIRAVQGPMIKESLRRVFSANYDMEFHTHPDLIKTGCLTVNGIKVPKSYWDIWSSFPSETDFYGYLEKYGSLISFVVSNSSKASTLLVPHGTSLRSRSVFYYGPKSRRTYKQEVYPVLDNLLDYIKKHSSNQRKLNNYFVNTFKFDMRRAITKIGDVFNFLPYFADNFEDEFIRG